MADVKISSLPTVGSVTTGDLIPAVNAGVTSRITVAQIRAVVMPVVLTSGTDVTGSLPTANQVAQALAGDASGTTAAVVNDIARGLKSATTTVSVSAAAAPTTGQVLKATGASTATWQTAPGTSAGAVNQVQASDGAGGMVDSAFTLTTAQSTWGTTATNSIVSQKPTAPLTTTDATITTLLTFPIPASTLVDFEVTVCGIRTGGSAGNPGDCYRAGLAFSYQRVGAAAPSIVGSAPVEIDKRIIGGGTAYLASIGGVSNDIWVRVTGVANNNINWNAILRAQQVG